MSETLAEILDRCLDDLRSEKATIASCLERYPEHAEALEPLLKAAQDMRSRLKPEAPTTAFRNATAARLTNLMRQPPPPRRVPLLPKLRLAGALTALAVALMGVSVAYASNSALPGDLLYGVKLGFERASLALSMDDAKLLLNQAETRIAEAEELMRLGRSQDVSEALEGYRGAMSQALEFRSENAAFREQLEQALERHEFVLMQVLDEAPEQAIPGLQEAFDRSGRQPAEPEDSQPVGPPDEAGPIQSGGPPDGEFVPPGWLKKTDTPGGN